jgi:hypothetical protein
MRSPWFLLCVLFAPAAGAAQGPRGCGDAERRQFDFWIGDWTVGDSAGGTTYGTNLITREENGCLIHEHWIGSRGGSGQSLNFFDLDSRKWVQVWVGSGGENLRLEGGLEDGRMVLTGSALGPGGSRISHRAVWSAEPGGMVRQYWRSTTDGGKTWTLVIDGWYRLKAKGAG